MDVVRYMDHVDPELASAQELNTDAEVLWADESLIEQEGCAPVPAEEKVVPPAGSGSDSVSAPGQQDLATIPAKYSPNFNPQDTTRAYDTSNPRVLANHSLFGSIASFGITTAVRATSALFTLASDAKEQPHEPKNAPIDLDDDTQLPQEPVNSVADVLVHWTEALGHTLRRIPIQVFIFNSAYATLTCGQQPEVRQNLLEYVINTAVGVTHSLYKWARRNRLHEHTVRIAGVLTKSVVAGARAYQEG